MGILNLNAIIIICVVALIVISIVLAIIIKDRRMDKLEIESLMKERKNSVNEENTNIDNKVYKNQTNLENLLTRMQNDLEAKPTDVITHFENDQEEKSIISYQELVKTLSSEKEMDITPKDMITKEIVKDDKVEAIKTEIQTDIGEITKVEIPEIEEKKKFKNTEFISPIYGIQEPNNEDVRISESKRYNRIDELLKSDDTRENRTLIEENLELEPLREEIKRNNEFLKALKEFRKNL